MQINNPLTYSGWFLDSGDLAQIRRWRSVIGGITTNQLILFEKEKIYNIPSHLKKIFKLVGPKLPVSVELPDSHATIADMLTLAQKYHALSPTNIVIKVPIIPTSTKGLKVISRLAKKGIRTNATIGINEAQLMLAAEAGRYFSGDGDNYISLFWGRSMESHVRSESNSPQATLRHTLDYLNSHSLNAKVIIGSIRSQQQVITAFSQGAHIVTITPQVLNQIMYTSRAKETVDQFDQAYLNVKHNSKLKLV